MDENTFQDELRRLKQRVSEMSVSSLQRQREHQEQQQQAFASQQRLWPYTPSSFSDLLENVKTQLDTMQRTVTAQVQQQAAWRQTASSYVGPSPAASSWPHEPTRNISLPPHGGFDGAATPIYWKLYSALKTDVQAIDEKVASLETSYLELEDRVDALDPHRFTPPGSEVGTEEVVQAVHQRGQDSTSPRRSLGDVATAAAGEGTSTRSSTGVTFRDKEIDRLEELLKRSYEVNKLNDATLEAKERDVLQSQTRALNAENSAAEVLHACQKQTSELERREVTIRRLSAELRDFKASRHHFMTKYVDENYRYKWLKQKKIQSEAELQRRIDELEHALAEFDEHKASVYHGELDKLQTFCAQKDAVILRQEEIIARGGKMMQERDAELDQLQSRHDELEKEKHSVDEHAAKLISTLRERDAMIRELRSNMNARTTRQQQLEDIAQLQARLSKEPAHVYPAKTFEHAIRGASNGSKASAIERWKPTPIPGFPRLPHEQDRARAWDHGAYVPFRHSFGSASPMSPATRQQHSGNHHDDRQPARSHQHNGHDFSDDQELVLKPCSRRSNHRQRAPPRLEDANADNNGDGMQHSEPSAENSVTAQAVDHSRKPARQSLPLDATFWPPLPAPVPAEGRRVESVPNLRGAVRAAAQQRSNGRATIAKPASMEELPRRRLQAYVEEDEGGVDGRDSSLLD